MEELVFGLCPLCSQQKQLEKSHYLGRALHLLSQDDSGAVFMTPQRIELSTRQIWAHLLCGECEDILAANESYAHQWINRKDRFQCWNVLEWLHRCGGRQTGRNSREPPSVFRRNVWRTLRSAYFGGRA